MYRAVWITSISLTNSTRLTPAMIQSADLVVTVCGHADELCPALPPHIAKRWIIGSPPDRPPPPRLKRAACPTDSTSEDQQRFLPIEEEACLPLLTSLISRGFAAPPRHLQPGQTSLVSSCPSGSDAAMSMAGCTRTVPTPAITGAALDARPGHGSSSALMARLDAVFRLCPE